MKSIYMLPFMLVACGLFELPKGDDPPPGTIDTDSGPCGQDLVSGTEKTINDGDGPRIAIEVPDGQGALAQPSDNYLCYGRGAEITHDLNTSTVVTNNQRLDPVDGFVSADPAVINTIATAQVRAWSDQVNEQTYSLSVGSGRTSIAPTDTRGLIIGAPSYNPAAGAYASAEHFHPPDGAHITCLVKLQERIRMRNNGGVRDIDWNFSDEQSVETSNPVNHVFGQVSFQSTLLHELGHCVGIDHPEENTNADFASIMGRYAGDSPVQHDHIALQDAEAIDFIYNDDQFWP